MSIRAGDMIGDRQKGLSCGETALGKCMLLARGPIFLLIALTCWAQPASTNGQLSTSASAEPAAIYRQIVTDAEAAQGRGEWKAALAGFHAIADGKDSDVPADVRARALRGIAETQALLEKQQASLWSVLSGWVSWPVYLLIALMAIGIYRYRLRQSPRAATRVSFEDLSEPRETRLAKSRVLTNNIRDLLQNPKPVQMSELHVDLMPGTDEGGFSGLSPTLAMEAVLGFEPSDHPVKVASLEFSLRDLFGFVSSFFSRPYLHTLDGWIDTRGDQVEAFAALRTYGSRARDDKWSVRCTGPRARERAIADLAAQIVVGTGKSTMTNNWQSFRNFHEALKLRFSDGAGSAEQDAPGPRTHLERALAFDSANWIARFNLGLALCRENQPQTALEHFKILERVFTEAWARTKHGHAAKAIVDGEFCPADQVAFQSVLTHIKEYPECPFLVLYNKAIALSNIGERHATVAALQILETIGNLRDSTLDGQFALPHREMASNLSRRSRTELALYGLSARANILAGVQTGVCPVGDADAGEIIESGLEQIRAISERISQICLLEQEQHWQSLQAARAVSLTALARVLAIQSQEAEAERLLREAIAAHPGLVGAYLHLAEMYQRCRENLSAMWPAQSEWLLRRALEISPGCTQATYLLGTLYSHPLVGRGEEAEALLASLKTHPEACLRLARILSDRAENAEALNCMRRYLVLCSHVSGEGVGCLELLLTRTEMDGGQGLNWRPVAETLEALRNNLAGWEKDRIANLLARIKDRQSVRSAAAR